VPAWPNDAQFGLNPGTQVGVEPGRVLDKPADKPTLLDAGIDKNLAHRANPLRHRHLPKEPNRAATFMLIAGSG
jgi:hypothetical protein